MNQTPKSQPISAVCPICGWVAEDRRGVAHKKLAVHLKLEHSASPVSSPKTEIVDTPEEPKEAFPSPEDREQMNLSQTLFFIKLKAKSAD